METIKNIILFAASLAVLITYHEVTDHSRYEHRYMKLLELREASIKDSVKMHKWFENVQLNYQELKNLEK